MHPNIEKLYRIAQKPHRLVIGLMSGTSLDGLDIALCHFEGSGLSTKVSLLKFASLPYEEDFKAEIRKVFSKKQVDLEQVCLLHPWIAQKHAAMVLYCLEQWKISSEDIDLIASHGQTIYHAPKKLHHNEKFGNASLQIGDGDHLAVGTGIITICDFRQKHIAAGAEGAPLAVYGDYLLFSKKGEHRILLNIGGIANFTSLPASGKAGEILSSDTGPGNTLMDGQMRKYTAGAAFDKDGAGAAKGKINGELLRALKDHPFFSYPLPKTTGPELFNDKYLEDAQQKSNTQALPLEDMLATLNRFTAETISDALQPILEDKQDKHLYLSGGGAHNKVLVDHLTVLLPECLIRPLSSLGIDPDAKEAILFAVLANECVGGEQDLVETGIAGMPAISMGKISFPS